MSEAALRGVFPYLVSPIRDSGEVDAPVLARLSRVPNIRYIKDASFNTGRLLPIINRVDGRLQAPLSAEGVEDVRRALAAIGALP